MNKGFALYMLVFIGLILASIAYSSADPISPTIAEARGDLAVGAGVFRALETGVSLLIKLTIGGIVTSVLVVAAREGWKRYKTWDRGERSRRWNPGPNARWQTGGGTNPMPRLKREDLMLMALMNRNMPTNGAMPRMSANRAPVDDESIELEF